MRTFILILTLFICRVFWCFADPSNTYADNPATLVFRISDETIFRYDDLCYPHRQVKLIFGKKPLKDAAEIVVTCNGKENAVKIPADKGGLTELVVDLPEGVADKRSSAAEVKVDVRLSGKKVFSQQTKLIPPETNPDLEEILVCWKTHLDIGFTDEIPRVIRFCKEDLIRSVLKPIEATARLPEPKRFIWMLPSWILYEAIFNNDDPEYVKRIETAVRNKQLIWHALPYTPYTEMMEEEELIRSLDYNKELAAYFNLPLATDAKLTDVPCNSWILPQVLAGAGVKFLHIGCNPTSTVVDVPVLSWWEGADDSKVLLGYAPNYSWEGTPPKDWPHKTWLFMKTEGEGAESPSIDEINGILDHIQKQLPGVRIRFGRPSEFADAVLAENPQLPVVRKDMPDTWIHGIMTEPYYTGRHRLNTMNLSALGALSVSGKIWGIPWQDVGPAMNYAYREGGMYSEHTWGFNAGFINLSPDYYPHLGHLDLKNNSLGYLYGDAFTQKYEQGRYDWFDRDFDNKRAYSVSQDSAVTALINNCMTRLADAVGTETGRIVVYNPLPWERDSRVSVELPDGVKPGSLKDAVTGGKVPFVSENNYLVFNATDLPSGGYKAYLLNPGKKKADKKLKEQDINCPVVTEHYIVKFDLERGGISSLADRVTGKKLVDSREHALGQFIHERYDRDEVHKFVNTYTRGNFHKDFGKPEMPDADQSPHLCITPSAWQATVTENEVEHVVSLVSDHTHGVADMIKLDFRFPKSEQFVDIEWTIVNKVPNTLPEGGWLCIPAAVEGKPVFRIGRPGASMDPAKDIVAGANRYLMCVASGITVKDGATGEGLGVASSDLPLWSAGKTGLWKFDKTYVPYKPELFANLYNNMWNTNFRLFIKGSWSARMRVWPVSDPDNEEQSLFTPSMEERQPVFTAYSNKAGGNLPVSDSGLQLSRKGVQVTAFHTAPDVGNAVLLRLWEKTGDSGRMTVTLPHGMRASKAWPVDLNGERTGEAIRIADNRFEVAMKAFAPVSFYIE